MSRIPIPLLEQFPSYSHARWGLGSTILQIPTQGLEKIVGTPASSPIASRVHPIYDNTIADWVKWRLCYEGGDEFIREYTSLFSNRESRLEFRRRQKMTPIPAFAKAAINEVKNAIFQRLIDVSRVGGSASYQQAVDGLLGGIDLKGASLNWFIGHYILPELLVMRKVGVFVDSPALPTNPSILDSKNKHPYFYPYRAENIRNWAYLTSAGNSEFAAVLLRDYEYVADEDTGLPINECVKLRLLYLNQNGKVTCRYYDDNGLVDTEIELNLTRIPFVQFEITESLMKDVANHQIALLNMESSDVSYAIKSNFPFYTEQFDQNSEPRYIKSAQNAYNAYYCPPGSETLQQVEQLPVVPRPETEHVDTGVSQGRKYGKGLERPGFIAPPSDPLKVSMEKQDRLKEDIRKLVHLALSTVQSKAVSAESKSIDNQGLESGLSYIGLELESGERKLAEIWSEYEGNGQPAATINYPRRWSLKTVKEINEEVDQHIKLKNEIPSSTFKKEMNKRIANAALGSRVPQSILDKINNELDSAKGATSDPKIIQTDMDLGILSQATGAELRGYPSSEVVQASQDHAERLARIMASQSGSALVKAGQTIENQQVLQQSANNLLQNPAARGIPDLSTNPSQDASSEKIGKRGRGPGNNNLNQSNKGA